MKITTRDVPPRAAWALEQAGVHPLLARLYAARGVGSKEQLDDGLALLLPPAGLKGAVNAAVLLADAIAKNKTYCALWRTTTVMVRRHARWPFGACACWVQSM